MRRFLAPTAILACLALTAPAVPAQEGAPSTLAGLVFRSGVEGREPVAVAETFPASAGEVHGRVEARDVAAEFTLPVAWKRAGQQIQTASFRVE